MHGRCADDVDARQWREMDGEENLVGMSERGCADGVRTESIQGSEMDGEKGPMDMTEHGCADVRRRCGRKGMNGNGEEKGRRARWVWASVDAQTCADGVGSLVPLTIP